MKYICKTGWIVRAYQWKGSLNEKFPNWMVAFDLNKDGYLMVHGLHCSMYYDKGDYIIIDKNGYLFRCKTSRQFKLYYKPLTFWNFIKYKFFGLKEKIYYLCYAGER